MEQRLEALATVYLTRRADLAVSKVGADIGVDLIVQLIRESEPSRKMFGVMLKGTTDPISNEAQATRKLNSMKVGPKGCELCMPVCVFLFSMQDNQGYYDRQAEPLIERDQVKIEVKKTLQAKILDPHSMDRLIEAVDSWYDHLFAKVVTQDARGRH